MAADFYIVPPRLIVGTFDRSNVVTSFNSLRGDITLVANASTGVRITSSGGKFTISIIDDFYIKKAGDYVTGNIVFTPTGTNYGLAVGSGPSDPGTGTTGSLFFNTTANTLRVYNGSAWGDIVSSGGISLATGDARYLKLDGTNTPTGNISMGSVFLRLANLATQSLPGVAGQIYFNTTTKVIDVYDGTKWQPAGQGITSLTPGIGISLSANPITSYGSVSVDQSYNFTWTGSHTFTNAITFAPTQTFDISKLIASGQKQGDLIFYNGSNWARVGIGTTGQVLTVGSSGTAISWINPAGGGPITSGVLEAIYGGTGYSNYNLGDLLVGAGSTFIKLARGTDHYVLSSSNTSATGLTWRTASALASTSSGPVGSYPGDFWFDSSDGSLSIWYDDGTSSQWVQVASAFSGSVFSGTQYSIPYYVSSIGLTGSDYFTNIGTGISILYNASSISTNTGALVVTGGVGIGGSLNVNSASRISNVVLNNGSIYGTLVGTATTAGIANTALSISISNATTNTSHPVTFTPTSGTSAGAALSSNPTLSYNPNSYILSVSGLGITATTESTTTATGALIVSGGVGIGGSLNVARVLTLGQPLRGIYGGTGHSTYTKGDILVGAGSTFIKFPVGTNSFVLLADSTSATGLSWGRAAIGITIAVPSDVNLVAYYPGTGASIASYNRVGINNATASLQVTSQNALPGLVVTATNGSVASGAEFVDPFGIVYWKFSPTNQILSGVNGGALSVDGSGFISILAPSSLLFYDSTNTYYTGFVGAATANTIYTLPATSPATGASVLQSTAGGVLSWVPMAANSSSFATTASNINTVQSFSSTSHSVILSPQTSGAGVALSSSPTITFNPSTNILNVSGLAVTAGTASTNTSTGALTVNGGVGISGQLTFARSSFGYTGINFNPTMSFIGNTTSAPLTFTVLSDNSLSWEGTSGQLFSIDNNLTSGEIFSVSDISGLPIISASAGQTVSINEFGGFTRIGNGSINATGTTNATLVVYGGIGITGNAFIGGTTNITSSITSISSSSGALVVSGGVGIGGSLYVASATAISGITINNGIITGTLVGSATSAGFATTANYSHQSGYAITSGTATTSYSAFVNVASTSSSHSLLFSPISASSSGTGLSINSTLNFNPSANILYTSGLAITASTVSSSVSTGALTVNGGVGISGRLSFNQAAFGTTGITTNPTFAMIGNTGDPIYMSVLEDNTISFEGSQGQLFSITPNLSTGYIYSVNDITGIPLLRANANGNVTANEYAGNFGIGLSNPSYKLHVIGSVGFTSVISSTSTTSGTLIVGGGVGIGGSLYVGSASNISNVILNNGNITGNLIGTATTSTNLNVVLAGSNLNHQLMFTPTAGSASGVAVSTNNTLVYNPSTDLLSVSGLAITAGTASTSPQTGALVVTGGVGIGGSLYVSGDFTVNGTTTTINSVTLTVDDKNIELGSVASPSDFTAEGGGITLRGSTDKSINWYTGTGWSSSESWNLSSGQTYKINNTTVLSNSSLGTGVTNSSLTALGTISTGVWAATAITTLYGGTGNLIPFTVGDLLYANTSTTWSRLAASSNSGYILASAGAGATPVYTNPATIIVGTATTANNINVVLAASNTNHPLLFTPSTGTASGAAISNDNTLVFNPSTEILTVSGLAVTSGLASTSTTTGALVVTGGVGIGNTLYVAGRVDASNYKAWVENRTLSSVDTCVGIGTFFINNGAHNLLLSLNVSDGGYSVAKNYSLTSYYNMSGWYIVAPISSTGAYNNNSSINFQLEAFQSFNNLTLRARSLGTGGNLKVYVQNVGQNITTFSTYNSVTSETAVTIYHPSAFASQEYNLFKINSSTASTTTSTGAMVVTGGVGIGGSLYVSSASNISNVILNNGTITGTLSGYATTSNNLRIASAGSSNLAHPVLFTPNSSTSGSAVSSDSTFSFNSSTEVLSVSGLAVTASTGSASPSAGALTVAGGVGIGGTVNIQGDETVFGRLYYTQSTVGIAGTTVIPSISFIGQNNNPITLSVLSDNTLSFEGSSGQLFSINNNLSSGTIFSVNDISGIPILRANANGTLSMGEFSGNVGIGLSLPSYKLHVAGDTNLSSGYVYRINGSSVLSSSTLGTGVTNSSLTSVGTITSGTWAGTLITSLYGGTGYSSYTKGDLLVGSGSTFIRVGAGTSNFVLSSNSMYPAGVGWTWVTAVGVGTAPPSNYHESDLWWNSTDGSLNLYYNDGDTNQWVEIVGGSGIDLSQQVHITSTLEATSIYTGALLVDGGAGFAGNVYLGGNLSVGSTIISGAWAGSAITGRYGGTGYTSYNKGDLLVGAGSTFIKVGTGFSHQVLNPVASTASGVGWTDLSLAAPISTCYGSFYSTSTQTVLAANTITPVTVNSTYESANMSIMGGAGTSSRIQVLSTGVYNIQFSAQLNLTVGTQPKVGDFWFRVDGTDVPWSNTKQTITGKDFQAVIALNFVSTLNSGQYFELMMSSSDQYFSLEATTGLTLPTRPNVPSIIITVTKVL